MLSRRGRSSFSPLGGQKSCADRRLEMFLGTQSNGHLISTSRRREEVIDDQITRVEGKEKEMEAQYD
jgi:hypothetical protein